MKHRTTWKGLEVEADIVTGDWEGDPDVPGGVHYFPPYVEAFIVCAPDGTDLTELLTEEADEQIMQKVLEEFINK